MRIYRIERKRLALVSDWLAHFQDPVKLHVGGKQNVRDTKTAEGQGEAAKARRA